MSKQVVWTSQFKKDYKLAMKRGLPIEELDHVIRLLANYGPLPESIRTMICLVIGRDSGNATSDQTGY